MKASKIRLLSPELVHRIAAGEVVENPSSAMKELVENSIDAGASKVSVLIAEGGLKLIEVKDNGSGMSRADLEACCQRHATSKISELDDLDKIFSLGFRGEALAALSSVSHLEITSLEKGSSEAWVLKRQGSEFETFPASYSQGTCVRVMDLFFNTPARKKFLKSTASESSKCVKVFKDLCVSHPEVELSLHLIDGSGEVVEDISYPQQSRLQRIASLFAQNPDSFFSSQVEGVVTGLKKLEIIFLKAPHYSKNSKDIYFIVNGRPVEDKRLPYALREAFGGLIEVGVFPRGVVYLDVEASDVDVNVHPQKKEIRWSRDFPLYSLIYNEVKRALDQQVNQKPSAPLVSEVSDSQSNLLSDFYSLSFSSPHHEMTTVTEGPKVFIDKKQDSAIKFSSLRVIGELGASWILCESPEGLIVIDQHAAHERVNFDRLIKNGNFTEALPLLLPMILKVPLSLRGREEEVLQVLENWAFEGRVLGHQTLELHAIPKSARKIDWKNTFEDIFDRIDQKLSTEALFKQLKVWIASSVACHGSVRRGQRLSHEEMSELLKSMDAVDWKEFCPHGRPTWLLYSHTHLEEGFHRS